MQNNAKKPHVAQVIDGAMDAIERANPRLRGVLPADYARRNVEAEKLGELIDLGQRQLRLDSAFITWPPAARPAS